MRWRGISKEEVEATLSEPDRIEWSGPKLNAYKAIGERRMRVTYLDLVTEIYIITAVDKKD